MAKSNENLRKLLETRVLQHGEKVFLLSENNGRKWTYSGFDGTVNKLANFLLSRGVTKGDVVSMLLPNGAEYIFAYFACFKIGAVAGPINSLLKTDEIHYVLDNSESKLLLVNSQFQTLLQRSEAPPTLIFDDVSALAGGQDEKLGDLTVEPDDDAIIIYTSGTTGRPKGCLLTHQNLIANARQISEWLGFGGDDRLLTVMPLFHMNAVSVTTMTALYAGGSTVVSPKFSASRFWEIVSDFQITSFGSVATMLSMLLQRYPDGMPDGLKTDRLRFAMCGSAPVPTEVLKKFEETFHCLVIEGYGLSESTCRSTFNPPNDKRRPGSCGIPIGNEMKIVDDSGNDVPDGELGEIVLRGDNICKSYFKDEAATAHAFRGGWFHTGDIGYRDADGFYYIADRKSDMIIRGGENIYPREIDEILYRHPAIASAAVVGVPDELYGEEVAAFVVLKNGKRVSESELTDFCKQQLADYKCPKKFYFVDDIPKGPTGKLLKRELAMSLQKHGA